MWQECDILAFVFFGFTGFWGYVAAAAFSIGVSYLGGLLFGQDLEEPEGAEAADSGGRSWSPHTTQQEGLPRSRAYGRNMHHGNIVSKWTDVDGNDREILYLIIEHGDGPTEGNIAGEVYLNDQPASNFPDVVVQERVGTMDQTAMTGFEKTKLEYVPNFELKQADGAHIFTTPNAFFDDIEYTICFPNGLCYYKKSGNRKTFQIHLHVRIREHPAGGWTSIFNDDIVSPSGGTTTPFFVKHVVNTLVPDTVERGKQYDLEFTRITADGGERLVSKSHLRSVREVVDVAFTRPGKSLTGIKALATAKLSGNIDVKIIREDRLINVWNGTVWDIQYSRNRAWIVWDLLTQPVISGSDPYTIERYEGVDPNQLDLAFFYSWAYFCSYQVADGYDGTEDRLACDIILDYQTDVWDLVHKISQIGRAYLWWSGNILTGWIDKAVILPSGLGDLITMDTVMARSWRNRWVGKDELAGVVEVYYRDKNQGYERTCVPFAKAAAGSYKRVISIEGIGITTYGTAIHVANHALTRNELIKNVNTFRQYKDAFRHKLGDVIRLQHRVPVWGQGYRCINCPTASTMVLDRTIVDVNVDDLLYVRSYDEANKEVSIDVYTVTGTAGSIITIAETWSPTPVKDNIVAVGVSGKIVTRRITKIESTVENYFDIEVETYDADLYDADSLDPDAPNKDYIWSVPAGTIIKPVARDETVDIVDSMLPPQNDFNELQTSNLQWNNNTPSAGYVSWSAKDGETPILVTIKGVTYDITPGNTDKRYIYWDENFTTEFKSTDLLSGVIADDKWPLCFNYLGLSDPAWGSRIIGTYKVDDNAISDGASAYAEGSVGLLLLTWSNMLTLTYESLGNPIYINCSAVLKATGNNNGAKICIQRKLNDELPWITVWSGQGDIWLETDYAQLITPIVEDSPAAGVWKYYFRGQKTLNGTRAILAYNRSMYLQELKK